MGSVTLYLFLIYIGGCHLCLQCIWDLGYCNHFKLCCFLQIRFELDTIFVIVNSIVILFRCKLCVCDVYLLNHTILVVMLIYRGPS
jgi:hypothetical protein